MRTMQGVLPWQSGEGFVPVSKQKKGYQVKNTRVRDTRCTRCKKLFLCQDVQEGVCVWCLYDLGLLQDQEQELTPATVSL